MQQIWLKLLEGGALIALFGLGLEFYRQWLVSKKENQLEIKRQLQEATRSSKERTEIKKDLEFIKGKINFILEWMSSNSSFK